VTFRTLSVRSVTLLSLGGSGAAGDTGLHDTVAVRDYPQLAESVSDR
jgi:hypothetical protein